MNYRKIALELQVLNREITKGMSRLSRLRAQRSKLLKVMEQVAKSYPS